MRLLSFLAALACVASAWGQGYPSKPIRLVVGYPPGGSGDFTARVIADELAKDLGPRQREEPYLGPNRAELIEILNAA